MKRKFDVVGLGSIAVDFLGTVEGWPEAGGKSPLEDFSITGGGLGATSMVAVARLGGKAALVGCLGESPMAVRARQALREESVDTSLILPRPDAEPTIAIVLADCDGRRTIFFSQEQVTYPLPDQLPLQDWPDSTHVVLVDAACGEAAVEMAEVASDHGVPVVLDAERDSESVEPLLNLSDHVVLAEEFAAHLTGKTEIRDILEGLRQRAEQSVVVTRGKRGCALSSAGTFFELPAFPVRVVDTTGCGDVFHGAYALAMARRKSCFEACVIASAAAAGCATRLGGREGIPTPQQLEASFGVKL